MPKRPRARGVRLTQADGPSTPVLLGPSANRTEILQNEANLDGAGCGLLSVAATRRLVRQVRFQELREGIPRSVVSALLVAVGAELSEAMRRPGIDLDFVRHACALQLA